jgi:hypothetical protein
MSSASAATPLLGSSSGAFTHVPGVELLSLAKLLFVALLVLHIALSPCDPMFTPGKAVDHARRLIELVMQQYEIADSHRPRRSSSCKFVLESIVLPSYYKS